MHAPSSLLFPLLDYPLLWVAISYLIGTLPFAVWVGQLAGHDPRQSGSRNPGASNVARTAGMKWGLITLLLDGAKGALCPLLILAGLLITNSPSQASQERIQWSVSLAEWAALSGFTAMIGHITSPWLSFRGGRGVATALGAMAALHGGIAGVSACIWLIVLLLTRTPAWASLVMSLSFILLSQLAAVPHHVALFAIGSAVLIAIRHWPHLTRLTSGPPPRAVAPRPQRRQRNKKRSKKQR